MNDNNKEFDEIDDSLVGSRDRSKELEKTYPNTAIKIDREQFSIFELNRRYERGKIKLDPDFQRNKVWNNQRKRELIESVIMGLPLQLIYTSSNAEGEHVIIDGKQRLTTFFDFLNNKFKLDKLNILPELNNHYFDDLNPKYQSKIEDFQLFLQVIKPPTPDRIQFDIFDRVNRGGVVLNNQEMRNALYQGSSTKLLEKLCKNETFKKMVRKMDKRMKDRYLVIRYLGFYIFHSEFDYNNEEKPLEYNGDIDEFLAKTMKYINNLSPEGISALEEIFNTAVERTYTVLGKDAFRIPNEGPRRNPINMALLETLLFLANNIEEIELLRLEVKELLQDEEFMFTLGRNRDNKSRVSKRFQKIKEVLRRNS